MERIDCLITYNIVYFERTKENIAVEMSFNDIDKFKEYLEYLKTMDKHIEKAYSLKKEMVQVDNSDDLFSSIILLNPDYEDDEYISLEVNTELNLLTMF